MRHLNPILRSSDTLRLILLTAAVCGASLWFLDTRAPFAMAVVACVFGFCARRREPRKRTPAFADQSLKWW